MFVDSIFMETASLHMFPRCQALLTALCENTLLFLALCGNGLGTGGAQAMGG